MGICKAIPLRCRPPPSLVRKPPPSLMREPCVSWFANQMSLFRAEGRQRCLSAVLMVRRYNRRFDAPPTRRRLDRAPPWSSPRWSCRRGVPMSVLSGEGYRRGCATSASASGRQYRPSPVLSESDREQVRDNELIWVSVSRPGSFHIFNEPAIPAKADS